MVRFESRLGSLSCLHAGLLTCLLAGGATAQDVLTVDDTPGTGADFSTLSAALAAAGEGDTILLRAGHYAAAQIDARSVNIVGDGGGSSVTIEGTLRIAHLSDDQFVSLAGLRLDAVSGPGTEAVHVFDNLGHVWMDDCDLFGELTHGWDEPQGGPGLRVENSANVVLRGSLVCGGSHTQSGGDMSGSGYWGLVSGSKLRVFDSIVVGGASVCTFTSCPIGSVSGINIDSGTLFLEGSTVSAGYTPPPPCQTPPWDCFGGPGPVMWLHAGAPQVFALGTEFPYGGAPDIDGGQLTTVPGAARAFTINSPAQIGELLTLDFAGAPGDGVLLLVGFEPANIPKAQYKGALLVGGASTLFTLGALSGAGTLALSAPVPAFPAAFESLPLVLQAAFITGDGPMLSDPARPILLQAGL